MHLMQKPCYKYKGLIIIIYYEEIYRYLLLLLYMAKVAAGTIMPILFKPGVHRLQAGACLHGFLKLFLCRHLYVCVFVCVCVCVCVCVSALEAINN